jgi:hypothetical protein
MEDGRSKKSRIEDRRSRIENAIGFMVLAEGGHIAAESKWHPDLLPPMERNGGRP